MNTAILSKIYAPQPPSHLLSRKRLNDVLRDSEDKSLIIISSPAGYGKTTLVLDYLRTSRKKYGWVSITENIDHLYSFYMYMVNALRQLNPLFGSNTQQLLDSLLERNKLTRNVKSSIEDVSIIFNDELRLYFHDKTALVLDDYHHMESVVWKDNAIDSLLKKAPENFQLIITTRQLPDLDFSYYMESSTMTKIEMEDLVFNEDEIKKLIASRYNITDEKVKELKDKFKGWITGIHLLMQGYGDNINTAVLHDQPIPENTFNELAELMINSMDAGLQELMLKTSVIENFHKELCETALGIDDFESKINKLLDQTALIYTIPITFEDQTKIISYNYVLLLKNYLKARLTKLKQPEEITGIYRSTYKYYLGKKDIITAINYMVEAGDHELALSSINSEYDNIFSGGKIEFLWNWFNRIDQSLVQNDMLSLINYAQTVKFYKGDIKEALAFLNKATELVNENTDAELIARLYSQKTLVMLTLGMSADIIKEIKAVTEKKSYSAIKPVLTYYLAYAMFHAGEHTTSSELLLESRNALDEEKNQKLIGIIYRTLGHINLVRGNYSNAVEYYDKYLKKNQNILDRFEVLCNLTLVSSQTASYEKAKVYLKEVENIIERFPTPILDLPYLTAKQAYLFESGKYEEAIKVMMDIRKRAEDNNNMNYLYLSERLLTECYYYMGDMENMEKYYTISLEHLDKNNKLKQIELNVTKALMTDDMNEKKEKLLLEAYIYFVENSLYLNLAQVCYYLGYYYYKTGNINDALKYVNECIELCKENGYHSFIIREYNRDSSLLDMSENSDYLNKIINKSNTFIV